MWTSREQGPSDTWAGVVQPLPPRDGPSGGGGGTPVKGSLLLPRSDLSSLRCKQWRIVMYFCIWGGHLFRSYGPSWVPSVCRRQFRVHLCCEFVWDSKFLYHVFYNYGTYVWYLNPFIITESMIFSFRY